MTQSALHTVGIHAAIIMDGNGRWAQAKGLPRTAGHKAGARALKRVAESASDAGIAVLTVYAFSQDNWKRPQDEVGALFRLMEDFLRREVDRCVANGLAVRAIGRRDRLPEHLVRKLREAEERTRGGGKLTLRIALDYSSRDAIAAAAGATKTWGAFSRRLGEVYGEPDPPPDVDLLIRTAGEQRLSDFLLWEAAYAELYFTSVLWPDFGPEDLRQAVNEYRRRRRTFGGLTAPASLTGRVA
jgi:undecaprenyl diphosphate synthase